VTIVFTVAMCALALALCTSFSYGFAYNRGYKQATAQATAQARRTEAMRRLGAESTWEFRESGEVSTLQTLIYARAPDGTEYASEAFGHSPQGWFRVDNAEVVTGESAKALTRRLIAFRTKKKVGL